MMAKRARRNQTLHEKTIFEVERHLHESLSGDSARGAPPREQRAWSEYCDRADRRPKWKEILSE